MEDLTFGEQVKIILSRKGLTIKELAEMIQAQTGKAMSRQNLTQRLGRDNFQEQDMRMIAAILGCPFRLSIFPGEAAEMQGSGMSEDAVQKFRDQQEAKKKKRQQQEPDDGVYQQVLVFDEEPDGQQHAEAAAEEGPVDEVPIEEQTDSAGEVQAEDYVNQEDTAYEESTVEAVDTTEEQAGSGEAVYGEAMADSSETWAADEVKPEAATEEEVDMTIGELYEIHEELKELEENVQAGEPIDGVKEELEKPLIQKEEPKAVKKEKKDRFRTGGIFQRRRANNVQEQKTAPKQVVEERKPIREVITPDSEDFEPVIKHQDVEEDLSLGEMNPYTGREYQSNSVRMHPTRIGYVQVYDRSQHRWTDMTEWAFLGYQERKKALLGKDYEPPIYLD